MKNKRFHIFLPFKNCVSDDGGTEMNECDAFNFPILYFS
jgi:hypothetical protein